MMPIRAMMAAAGGAVDGPVNWSNYNATGDKTPTVFSAVASQRMSNVNIDASRVLLVYRGVSGFCQARIASVDGSGATTYGTETAILSAVIIDSAVDLLDETHAIIAVESGGAVKTIAIEFSGTTITTVGTAVNTETVNSDHLTIAAVSSTVFYTAYEDTGANNRVFYATVSGTTVTMGNGIDFSTQTTTDMSMCKLNSTQAIILRVGGFPDYQAHLIGFTGTTPQLDYTLTVKNGSFSPRATDIKRIDDNAVFAVYSSSFGTIDCWARIITESGGVLSLGANEVVTNTNQGEWQGVALPDATHAVVTVGINSVAVETTVVEISGTTLTPLTAYQNVTTDKEYLASAAVGQKWVMVMYEDDNNFSFGTSIVLGV